ncbi:MAG: histidine phosphatase family protein [Candidatus Methanoperedens sp.]|nr:histidine phosphatase family protein [Candidatus Methanoperedens sp.]
MLNNKIGRWYILIAVIGIIILAVIALSGKAPLQGMTGKVIVSPPVCSVPTKIVLVRHAETSWNVLGIMQGNANLPLDANGTAQEQMLANSTRNKTVNVVYSSPRDRAYDTAVAIASAHQLPVKVEDDLREIGNGIYTGYKPSQVPSDINFSFSTNPDFALPSGVPNTANLQDPSFVKGIYFEGESLNMAANRSWNELTDIAKDHCGKNIVSVTHGGIIQIALTKAHGLPMTQYSSFKVPIASQTVLEFEPNSSVFVLPDW